MAPATVTLSTLATAANTMLTAHQIATSKELVSQNSLTQLHLGYQVQADSVRVTTHSMEPPVLTRSETEGTERVYRPCYFFWV